MIFGKTIENMDASDIQLLVDNGIAEMQTSNLKETTIPIEIETKRNLRLTFLLLQMHLVEHL